MPRQLSRAEQEFITANRDKMTASEMCSDMHGIGEKTVADFLETSVMPKEKPEETPQERQQKVQKRTGLTAGKLMARDPARGIAAMTPGASELADVHREQNVPSITKSAKSRPNRVFVMDPSKKVR